MSTTKATTWLVKPCTRGCASNSRLLDHPQQGVKEGFLEEVSSESTQMSRAEPGNVGRSESTPPHPPHSPPRPPSSPTCGKLVYISQCGSPLGCLLRPSLQSQTLILLSAAISSISARLASAFILIFHVSVLLAFSPPIFSGGIWQWVENGPSKLHIHEELLSVA